MLTSDQRWLLRAMGGWPIRDCLIGPEGVAHLMTSCWGGSSRRIDGGPGWLAGGFQCGHGRIVSPMFASTVLYHDDTDEFRAEPVRVAITTAQLNRFARTLPAELVDEMRDNQTQDHANTVLRSRFCHCGRGADGSCCYDHMHEKRICPPTQQQEDDAIAESLRIDDWTEHLLNRALGFEEVDAEPVGQLELFRQLDIYDVLESGDPDGCSPYGCRSGEAVTDERDAS